MGKVIPDYSKVSITAPYFESTWEIINKKINKLFGNEKRNAEYYSPEAICRELKLLMLGMYEDNLIMSFDEPNYNIKDGRYDFILFFEPFCEQGDISLELEMEVNVSGI